MARYSVITSRGDHVSDHRTGRGAVRAARKACLDSEGELHISLYADKHARVGRVVAHISFTGEWDGQRHPLTFWNDGEPIF